MKMPRRLALGYFGNSRGNAIAIVTTTSPIASYTYLLAHRTFSLTPICLHGTHPEQSGFVLDYALLRSER